MYLNVKIYSIEYFAKNYKKFLINAHNIGSDLIKGKINEDIIVDMGVSGIIKFKKDRIFDNGVSEPYNIRIYTDGNIEAGFISNGTFFIINNQRIEASTDGFLTHFHRNGTPSNFNITKNQQIKIGNNYFKIKKLGNKIDNYTLKADYHSYCELHDLEIHENGNIKRLHLLEDTTLIIGTYKLIFKSKTDYWPVDTIFYNSEEFKKGMIGDKRRFLKIGQRRYMVETGNLITFYKNRLIKNIDYNSDYYKRKNIWFNKNQEECESEDVYNLE